MRTRSTCPRPRCDAGSCALSAGIRLSGDIADPYALAVEATIERQGAVVWQASTSTSQLHRRLTDLAEALFRALDFPDGAVLSTGTGIVPDLELSALASDVVTITIDEVGSLSNTVVMGNDAFAPLASEAAGDRPRTPR